MLTKLGIFFLTIGTVKILYAAFLMVKRRKD